MNKLLKDLIKEIPFDPNAAGCKNKEEFIAAMEMHEAVLAVKAESLGETELVDALDVFRRNLRDWINGTISDENKALLEDAMSVMRKYVDMVEFPELSDE